jgi:YHS domain-containing protein
MRGLIQMACVFAMTASAAAQTLGTFRYDPVELVKGNQVEGDEAIHADHYLFRYLFATAGNKTEFEKSPQRYEIQMGGGCGRMGPLSGVGRTDLFAVHDGRIYIFASEGCRSTFSKHPKELIEGPDEKPVVDPDAVRRANELLDRAAEAMGGAAKIDAVKSYRQRVETQVDYEGRKVDQVDALTLAFPDRIHHEYAWGEARYGSVAVDDRGWFQSKDDLRPMHPQQRAAMRRKHLAHHPLAILKQRGRPGFVAGAGGPDKLAVNGDTIDIEKVTVWFDGVTTELGIDPKSGRIHSVAYRGRGPKIMLGRVRRVFTEFREVDGLTLPVASTVSFDGDPIEDSAVTLTSVSINDADATIFEPPSGL